MFKSSKTQEGSQSTCIEEGSAVGDAGGDAAASPAIPAIAQSGQLGDSSWLLNDSAYDGTGLRVLAGSTAIAAALSDVQDTTRDMGSDDGSDSDVTALAPRPAVGVSTAVNNEETVAMDRQPSFDDAQTPSIATANLPGMSFAASSNGPSTLSTYLASVTSSPRSRSLSTSSLASFPTDLLSDASATDAEDESRSDTGSVGGEEDIWSINSVAGSLSQLIMPAVPVEAASSGASDSDRTSSSNNRGKERQRDNGIDASTSDHNLRFVIIGTDDALKHDLKAMLGRRSTRSRIKRGSETLGPSGSVKADRPQRTTFECVSTLLEAQTRLLQPFEALKGLLKPDLNDAGASLVEAVLPFLLGNAGGVDACFWLIDPDKRVSLAQHVSQHYADLRRLCRIASVFPIIRADLLAADISATSQLVQGDLEMWGLSPNGKISSLRNRARVLTVRPHQKEDIELTQALREAQLRSKSVALYRKWSMPPKSTFVRPVLPRARSGSSWSRPADSDNFGSSGELKSEDLALSVSSSALVSPTSPTSPISSTGWPLGRARQRESLCRTEHLDPLHARSLLRLIGLQLADAFTALRATLAHFWVPRRDTLAHELIQPESAACSSNRETAATQELEEVAPRTANSSAVGTNSRRGKLYWTVLLLGVVVLAL